MVFGHKKGNIKAAMTFFVLGQTRATNASIKSYVSLPGWLCYALVSCCCGGKVIEGIFCMQICDTESNKTKSLTLRI